MRSPPPHKTTKNPDKNYNSNLTQNIHNYSTNYVSDLIFVIQQ
jgi:hypothetical protein